MAKVREKTEADLAWDEIRREIEYRLNLLSAHHKARMKNTVLPTMQAKFETALGEGRLLRFEDLALDAQAWFDSLGRELSA